MVFLMKLGLVLINRGTYGYSEFFKLFSGG